MVVQLKSPELNQEQYQNLVDYGGLNLPFSKSDFYFQIQDGVTVTVTTDEWADNFRLRCKHYGFNFDRLIAEHSLLIYATSLERLNAHIQGFCHNVKEKLTQ